MAFEERAKDHWTDERLKALTGSKQLLLLPNDAPGLLRAMGILDAHAQMHPTRVRKYLQINHMLSFMKPALEELSAVNLQLVDAGCGRSALGFLVAWWLGKQGRKARILGIDRGSDVIRGCRERAKIAGLDDMAFLVADLDTVMLGDVWQQTFGDALVLDGLLALHACDTATDTALAMAVRHEARFFAVAPCCQAELSRQWATLPPGPLSPIHSNPHLRRTAAATVTDAMRAELMRSAGYEVRTVEFVEAHHTPKNTLVYGHRRDAMSGRDGYEQLKQATGGCGIGLEERLASSTA
jgi:hypothetical protein